MESFRETLLNITKYTSWHFWDHGEYPWNRDILYNQLFIYILLLGNTLNYDIVVIVDFKI